MPATRATETVSPAPLPGLAVAVGLAVLAACSPVVDDPTPRLLTPQEMRDGIEAARTARPVAAAEIEGRAASLRGRASALRSQPVVSPDERDDLRRRARTLSEPAT